MTVLLLRPYLPGDAEATRRCFHRAVHGTAAADYDDGQLASWAPDEFDAAAWALRRENTATWVAERDGRLVGFSDVDDSGYIDMMFVDPAAARTGVASALLEKVTEVARTNGATQLTVSASITARPLFERHGFTVVAEQLVELRGSALTNFRMTRDL
ncbi:putative acetyltransferase [Conyzicola lurida]|uniref:Putative acetyltransferase n=1 Tax=Conyzicola lurida TaxID=1172621 RepID=A0A841AGZ4_9MICO|nr:GNAT family N-acetyltransferase [Conyzicola lurida]MBB5843100.1 putative acetyltransferase [Conyzicola lurida]